jgi:hypothetical protein
MPLPRPAPGTLRWWVVGTVGIAAGIALATWLGLSSTVGRPSWQTLAYKVEGDRSVSVTFSVHRSGGGPVTCTVRAMARDFSTVGSIDVRVPRSASDDSVQTVSVRTTSRAVTGEVRTCS